MLTGKAVCFTGHRKIPEGKLEFVRHELRREVTRAIADGYTHFISGFAEGTGLMAAAIVLELQQQYPLITLEAAIPYRNRVKSLYKDKNAIPLLEGCVAVGVWNETYAPNIFWVQNRKMVEASSRVIAVFDGRFKSGTAQTIRIARAQGKEVRVIPI
jgi:uncharacterized phage-like protein YoqJ